MNETTLDHERVWSTIALTPEAASRLTLVEARVYALLAYHAATRTRVSIIRVGSVLDERGVKLGAERAREVISDLHDAGLVMISEVGASDDRPRAVFLSNTSRSTGGSPDKKMMGTPVGGGFRAPHNLRQDLRDKLILLHRQAQEHNRTPGEDRDAQWMARLREITEHRAAAFHEWSTITRSVVIKVEANRLTDAAQTLAAQAERIKARDARRATANKKRQAAEARKETTD